MRPVRVLQVVSDLGVGGGQEVVRTLARYLTEVDCIPVVVTLRDGPLRADLERSGVTVEVLTGRTHSLTSLPAAIRELRQLRTDLAAVVARHRIEVIQTHLLRVLDFLVLTLRAEPGVRRVFWTFHNARLGLRPDQLPAHAWLLRPKRLMYRLLYFMAGRSVDGFVAVSDEVAAAVRADFHPPDRRVFTIPNGVDTERYGQLIDRKSVRERIGIPGDARVLIVVAKLMEQKGHVFLLSALPPILERNPDLHVLLVGEGPLRSTLSANIGRLQEEARFHLVGNRRDISDLLAASDLFVLPSLWEGLPMALLEAMASGLPAVVTSVSGSGQVVVDGVSGLVVPPGDVEALSTAISVMLDEPDRAQQMGRAARERVEHSLQRAHPGRSPRGDVPRNNRMSSRTDGPLRLSYIIGTYPVLTETFIDREVETMLERGVDLEIVSIRRPRATISASQLALSRRVRYLLPASVSGLIRAHLSAMLRRPRAYFGTLAWLLTRRHAASRSRTALHFATGVYAAWVLRHRRGIHIHAHFVDRAATVALVASRLLDTTYSVTAHAAEIYVRPVLLPERIGQAAFAVTCTEYNRQHLASVVGPVVARRVMRLYHGLDLAAFAGMEGRPSESSGHLLLAVAQLKEKKGLRYLIEACRLLADRGYGFRCEIVGDGPLRGDLERLIGELELEDIVVLTGAMPFSEVLERYRHASAFVLPCVVASDGDRDGIPNSILEAMAAGLPVVSTPISGIPEVVRDGDTGLVVAPADAIAIADAVTRLFDDPDRAAQFGANGRALVHREFDLDRNVDSLIARFSRLKQA